MELKPIPLLLLAAAFMLVTEGCGRDNKIADGPTSLHAVAPTPGPSTATSAPSPVEITGKDALLVAATSRDDGFWSEWIDAEALYHSQSALCQAAFTPLEYSIALTTVKQFMLQTAKVKQGDLYNTERKFKVTYFEPPVAYLTWIWEIDGASLWKPSNKVWLLEGGEWLAHDCEFSLSFRDYWRAVDVNGNGSLTRDKALLAEELLAVDRSRQLAFFADDIDAESLYESWSIGCHVKGGLTEYRSYMPWIKKLVADLLGVQQDQIPDLEEASKIVYFEPPLAYLLAEYSLNGKTLSKEPTPKKYILEGEKWRYHDCQS